MQVKYIARPRVYGGTISDETGNDRAFLNPSFTATTHQQARLPPDKRPL